MVEQVLPLWLWLILGMAALGVYLMLTARGEGGQKRVRRAGAGLFGLSLVLLAATVGHRIAWWPELELASAHSTFLLTVLAGCSVVSALMTITSRRSSSSALWFTFLLVSNCGLYALQDAQFLAVAVLLISAGSLSVCWLLFARWTEQQSTHQDDVSLNEPFLACVGGGLIAMTLVGTIHYALATEAKRTIDVVALRESNSLRHSVFPKLAAPATDTGENGAGKDNVSRTLGASFYERYWVGLEIIAVLMLVTVVTATLLFMDVTASRQSSNDQSEQPEPA